MPAQQQAQKKPKTKAEMNHELKMVRVKNEVAADQHDRTKEQAALQHRQSKLDLQADREAREHEKDMAEHKYELALLDPEVAKMQGLRRLLGTSYEKISSTVKNAISKIAGIQSQSHDDLVTNDDKHRRNRVRSDAVEVRAGDTGNKKNLVKVDPDLPDSKTVQGMMDKLRLSSPRTFHARLKKKLRESVIEEGIEITNPQLSGEMWYTGTYVPFLPHHAQSIRDAMQRYNDSARYIETAKPIQHFIGITGKEVPDKFPMPQITNAETGEQYIGRVKRKFRTFIKSNVPIKYKMAVARAAAPDLADNMVWVKDGFGTPPTEYHRAPAPGSVIHNDNLAAQAAALPRGYSKSTRYPMIQHEGTGYYFTSNDLVRDHTGEKVSSTPIRNALLDGHIEELKHLRRVHGVNVYLSKTERYISQEKYKAQYAHNNATHAAALGVPEDHPAVAANREMFDWMANAWLSVEDNARQAYARRTNKKIQESIEEIVYVDLTEDRRKSAGVGERLLRAQSLRTTGKRIGSKPSPPTNEKLLMRKARRAAHYEIRKRIAPNYSSLSTGQKQEIDDRIARMPELKKLVDAHYKKYSKKATEHAHSSSHPKKLK